MCLRRGYSNDIYDDAPEPDGFSPRGDVLCWNCTVQRLWKLWSTLLVKGIVLRWVGSCYCNRFVGDTLSRVLREEDSCLGVTLKRLKACFEPHQDRLDPTSIILSGHGE